MSSDSSYCYATIEDFMVMTMRPTLLSGTCAKTVAKLLKSQC